MSVINRILALFLVIIGLLTPSWTLKSVPMYRDGVGAKKSYNCGSGRMSDLKGKTDEDCTMQLIGETDLSAFDKYRSVLEGNGYQEVFQNTIDKNYSYAYRNSKGKQLYLTYCDVNKEARIIDDPCSDAYENFGYSFSDGESAEVFQYGFMHFDWETYTDDTIYAKNGMLYIIRLADNKLMVIDAGASLNCANYNIDRILAFMHELTGTKSGEKIDIALWFCTHPHNDHLAVFGKLLDIYHDEINLERTMYNFPAEKNPMPKGALTQPVRELLAKYYPNAKYIKPHSGYEFSLADINIRVLYTHENNVDVHTGTLDVDNINDCSTVIKIEIQGKSFLFLGDSNTLVQSKLLEMYRNKTLKSDVVQAAHHLYNKMNKLYSVVLPEYAFCSQSKERNLIKNMPGYVGLIDYVPEDNLLFANQGTYGIRVKDGELVVSLRPLDAVPYDGSGVLGYHVAASSPNDDADV